MKLEASPVGDGGGMVQVETQLASLTIQLEMLTKGKEKWEQVWCTKCRNEGHHKDECPTFVHYLATGAPNPLSGGEILSMNTTNKDTKGEYWDNKKMKF